MYCDFPSLGRCCFCMPLRRGVLTFGYLNLLFSAFMVGQYSYNYHTDRYDHKPVLVYHGVVSRVPSELCITMYCLDIVFNVVLLYGAHRKLLVFVKTNYYYTLATIMATVLLQIVEFSTTHRYHPIETFAILMAGLLIQLYLLILVRSLVKKLEVSGPHSFDNQLNQVVSGEQKVEANGVYKNNTVVPI